MTDVYPPFGLGPTYPFQVRVRQIRGYGWRRDIPDHRDLVYEPTIAAEKTPDTVDLQGSCPHIYSQGALGSCTAQAIAAAIQFARMKQGLGDSSFIPSRLFIYFGERVIEGTEGLDSGASLRDGIKVVSTDGACFEQGRNSWPYDVSQFAKLPPQASFDAAKSDKVLKYYRLEQSTDHLEACIAEGFPFVFGFAVFEGLQRPEVARSGVLQMPDKDERPIGGHAVMAVGYDRNAKRFKIRNSWGAAWGQQGYFWMPYEFVSSPRYASDFWTIRLAEAE